MFTKRDKKLASLFVSNLASNRAAELSQVQKQLALSSSSCNQISITRVLPRAQRRADLDLWRALSPIRLGRPTWNEIGLLHSTPFTARRIASSSSAEPACSACLSPSQKSDQLICMRDRSQQIKSASSASCIWLFSAWISASISTFPLPPCCPFSYCSAIS